MKVRDHNGQLMRWDQIVTSYLTRLSKSFYIAYFSPQDSLNDCLNDMLLVSTKPYDELDLILCPIMEKKKSVTTWSLGVINYFNATVYTYYPLAPYIYRKSDSRILIELSRKIQPHSKLKSAFDTEIEQPKQFKPEDGAFFILTYAELLCLNYDDHQLTSGQPKLLTFSQKYIHKVRQNTFGRQKYDSELPQLLDVRELKRYVRSYSDRFESDQSESDQSKSEESITVEPVRKRKKRSYPLLDDVTKEMVQQWAETRLTMPISHARFKCIRFNQKSNLFNFPDPKNALNNKIHTIHWIYYNIACLNVLVSFEGEEITRWVAFNDVLKVDVDRKLAEFIKNSMLSRVSGAICRMLP